MSFEVLRALTVEAAGLASRVRFLWHGGEPTLAGRPFFERAIELQRAHSAVPFENFLQTNSVRLDDDWIDFLLAERFRVRVSLDGPSAAHDLFRRNATGEGTHRPVTNAIANMCRRGLVPHVSCVVTEQTAPFIRDVYLYLRDLGVMELSFIPAFVAGDEQLTLGTDSYVNVYTSLFDLWANDTVPVRIREIDGIVAGLMGLSVGDCTYTGTCADVCRAEPSGNVHPCELHTGGAAECYGSIGSEPLADILARRHLGVVSKIAFEANRMSRSCRWHELCHGGCYARLIDGPDGRKTFPYCCDARGQVFSYIAERLREQRAPSMRIPSS